MIINERCNLNALVCSVDENKEIENVYYSMAEFAHAYPDNDKEFVVKFQIFDIEIEQVPCWAKDYYDTAEEALKDFMESDDAVF